MNCATTADALRPVLFGAGEAKPRQEDGSLTLGEVAESSLQTEVDDQVGHAPRVYVPVGDCPCWCVIATSRRSLDDARAACIPGQRAARSSGLMASRPKLARVRAPSARKSRASTTDAIVISASIVGVSTPTRTARSVKKTRE